MGSTAVELPQMQYRRLGRSGLKVSAISLGGWITYGGNVEDDIGISCMKAAYDVGINFFDCAENYQDGESERAMGRAIKKLGWKRNDIVISTKINWGGAYGQNPVNNSGLSRKHIIEGMNGSLERLQLDYVDLVYAHRPDRETPIEETVRAFNHLIDTGKAFYWGTSEWNADEIATAWRVADRLNLIGPLMEQPEYNMLTREKVEREFVGQIEMTGLGLTVFSPLKQGFLTGKYNDRISEDSRLATSTDGAVTGFAAALKTKEGRTNIELVRKLKPIADKLNVPQATLALAWVLRNPHVSSAITGASRPEQVYGSVKALDLVPKLTDEIMAEIDQVLGNKPEAMQRRFT